MQVLKHIDSWGCELTWAVEKDAVVLFTAKTRKECKEWAVAYGFKPDFSCKTRVVKQH